MTINNWSVNWDSDGRRRHDPCDYKVACAGERTQGIALFEKDGDPQLMATYYNSPCCQGCACAIVTREGMKGAITVKQLAEKIHHVAVTEKFRR